MVKYAVLIVMVVLGSALSACAQADFVDLFRVDECSQQFAVDTTRPHINGSNYRNNQGLACYQNKNSARPVDDIIRFSNTLRWGDICGQWDGAVYCMQGWSSMSEEDAVAMLENRTAIFTIGDDISTHGSLAASIYHFPRRVCSNYEVKSELTKYLSTDLSCLKRGDHVEFYRCYETLDCELDHINFEYQNANLALIRMIERRSAGALKCMRNVIETTACGTEAKELLTFISELQMPSIVDTGNLNITAPDVNFGSDHRCTVGVYGDPHLLYCDADQLETCSSPGEQVYLSNRYMDIRGTNVELSYWKTPKPTVIRKIEITFKSADGKSHVTTSTADNGTLPGTFENGKTTIGQGYDRVSMAAISAYKVIFIQRSMGAILVLRRWGNNYFFTLRMSSSVAKASHGLLGTGCPPSQIINRNANRPRLRRAVVTQKECDSACESMVNETMMMATCKYDCFVTKDLSFVNMSADAVEDIFEVRDRDFELMESARIYEKSRKPTSTPDKPMTTPDKPTTMPDKPTTTPDKPTTTTDKPTTTPDKPTTTPDKPTTTPDKQTSTPDKPMTTPDKPTTTPDNPTTTPDKSTAAIDKPTTNPDKPTTTPDKPTTMPDKQTTTPDKPTTTPDKSTAATDKPTTIPDKPTTTPDKPITTHVSTVPGIEAFWEHIMRWFRHYFN